MAKKKKKKIKFTNLFLLIVLLYILVQVVIWTIGYFTKTMVLEEENIDLQIKKKAIVVMDETIIKANEDGIIKYNVEDGEKIKNDKSLFTISQSGQNEEISQKIDDLKNEINDLEKSKNSMNSNIILNKKEELKILENQKQKYYTENISPTSGIVSFEYDNDYEKVKLDKLDDINSNILDSLENDFIKINSNTHKVSSSEVALRIINPNETYICIFQNKDKNHFKEAQDLKIISNGQAIKAKIDKIYEKKDEDVIVIKIMEQNMSIYNTRVQEFDIIYKNIKGFKIPVESVVEKNNKLGVYVINEENNMPEFVGLGKNYYKDAKYYYVDYNKNKDENKLNLYDRILLYPNFINKNIKVSR